MKIIKIDKRISLLFIVALFVSSNTVAFQKKTDGVVISLKKNSPDLARSIRLQVITDDIIRVTVTPEDKVTDQKSLITSYTQTQTKGWDVQQSGNTVILKTSRLRAIVSLVSGEVSFTDINGNIILQEQRGGGKTFAPIEVEGSKGYSFRQVFESPADEAFYGLGQHQSDEFNWKGRNEELFQYNTKVGMYSNRAIM
jgi:alpha-D-xyloside xylohydrolase